MLFVRGGAEILCILYTFLLGWLWLCVSKSPGNSLLLHSAFQLCGFCLFFPPGWIFWLGLGLSLAHPLQLLPVLWLPSAVWRQRGSGCSALPAHHRGGDASASEHVLQTQWKVGEISSFPWMFQESQHLPSGTEHQPGLGGQAPRTVPATVSGMSLDGTPGWGQAAQAMEQGSDGKFI